MAYKMPNPSGVTCPRESAFDMPYSLSAYVLTIIASVCRVWTGVLDFQKFDKAN